MPTGQPIENFEAHFWGLVDQSGGYESCWSWRLAPTKWGYGQIQMGSRKRRAHQVAWILTHGREIPDGLVIDHICHNDSGCPGGKTCTHRLCCNPAHLEAVTQGENIRRSRNVGRHNSDKTHCSRGHPFSGENLAPHHGRDDWRACRTCQREANRRSRQKRKS